MVNIFLILLLVAGIVVGILAAAGVFKTSSGNKESGFQRKEVYINPQTFGTGFIKDHLPPQQKIADNCNKTIHTVQQPYVNYGPNLCDVDCDVNIFNNPP